ncbi:hypothetical protein GCM10007901_05090 [Dyella acidisoli]|uniref:Alpha/beta hydrolase n=2 Tax=Dyella acidisoli TaxID=1867834 RepID=A0ABQ5XIP6_9GAMM|nr:hypothetical protein GCM10007901_05090 [Dyella acidisoli]
MREFDPRYEVSGSTTGTGAPAESQKVIAFFIGGAGDKESYYGAGPYHNIEVPKTILDNWEGGLKSKDLYISYDLGYYQIHNDSDIKKFVIDVIPTKSNPVYIVGHSLGGWNGAHLSRKLVDAGYNVQMLVTLDPVGKGFLVELFSAIPFHPETTPKAKFWINVHATPATSDSSDDVADFGVRWVIPSGPDINVDSNTHHADAGGLFNTTAGDGKSVAGMMYMSIRSNTNGAPTNADSDE